MIAELRQKGYQIHISWVRGHANHTGNEYVDCLAKKGVEMHRRMSSLSPNIPISSTKLLSAELGRLLINNGTKSGVVTHFVPKQKTFFLERTGIGRSSSRTCLAAP